MEYDDIIVGAGSSGAVLAARLSENARRNVLPLKAGQDYPTLPETPAEVLDGNFMPLFAYAWQLTAEALPGRTVPHAPRKVTGGASAVNGTTALRGIPAGYGDR